jgi:dTDP-4-dehydrorhamnose reductase
MRVVITGAHGLLAAAIVREFAANHELVLLSHERLDITDDRAVAHTIATERPSAVINCAVYNGVDAAEDEPAQALRVNAFGVLALAKATRDIAATLVHFSSDFVFDGETDHPYSEEDRANPRSTYGASKLLGDWFALASPRAYVMRVESLFGPPNAAGRRGSLATIVDHLRRGEEVPVFVDRVVSPSCTLDVARATRVLVERQAPPGLYHCVNSGHATWSEIAEHAAQLLGLPLRKRELTLETAGLRARRPRYCALSNAKLAAAGVNMRTWEDALAEFLGVPRL